MGVIGVPLMGAVGVLAQLFAAREKVLVWIKGEIDPRARIDWPAEDAQQLVPARLDQRWPNVRVWRLPARLRSAPPAR